MASSTLFDKVAEELMDEDEFLRNAVYETHHWLRSQKDSNVLNYVASIVQKSHTDLDLIDAYGYQIVDRMVSSGQLAMCQVHVGFGPFADINIQDNQNALSSVHGSFSFNVMNGPGPECDGYMECSDQIKLTTCDGTGRKYPVPLTCVPLEIGSTCGTRTFRHILEDGGVARWPYGSEWITVFMAVDQSCTRVFLRQKSGVKR